MAVKLVSSTKIYLDARKLLDIILDIVPNFPRAYKFTIGAKLQEIGVNLMQEIAVAYINKDKAETVKHLTEFQAEFETMKTLMRIAGEREWIKGRGKFANIIELMDEIGKQSSAWKNKVVNTLCSQNRNVMTDREKVLNMIEPHVFKEYVYIKGHYEVLAIKNKHKLRYQTMQRIRNGDY